VDSCSQRFGMDWGRMKLGLGLGGLGDRLGSAAWDKVPRAEKWRGGGGSGARERRERGASEKVEVGGKACERMPSARRRRTGSARKPLYSTRVSPMGFASFLHASMLASTRFPPEENFSPFCTLSLH
jgi:hypothetical protein